MKKFIAFLLIAMFMVIMMGNSIIGAPTSKSTDKIQVNVKLEDLGLCITDGGISQEPDMFSGRLNDYIDLGMKTIRTNLDFDSPSDYIYQINYKTKHLLEATAEKGLLVKALLPIINNPAEWLATNENARFKDQNGRLSISVVSYWYDGIYDYSEKALRAQLDELKKHDLLRTLSAIHVDLGIWSELLYPGPLAQNDPDGEQVLWCYGDNAVTDFRNKMQKKYGTISRANKAWSTSYTSFDKVSPPKPGKVQGQLWEDMLNWYLQVKRDFAEWQITMYKRVVGEYYENMPLILSVTGGGSITNMEWNKSVKTGIATTSIMLGVENNYIVDLANKYGCMLQYTGLDEPENLISLLTYMRNSGMPDIPIFGENASFVIGICDPKLLVNLVEQYGLAGLDFTFAGILYEADGITKNKLYYELKSNMKLLKKSVNNRVLWMPPKNNPEPKGDVLRYDVKFDKVKEDENAFVFIKISTLNYCLVKSKTVSKPLIGKNGFWIKSV